MTRYQSPEFVAVAHTSDQSAQSYRRVHRLCRELADDRIPTKIRIGGGLLTVTVAEPDVLRAQPHLTAWVLEDTAAPVAVGSGAASR